MGNNGVKSIVLIAILVVMSFLIGSQISNDKMVSLGIVAASVGLFLLLYLGARSWWLLFLVPPVFGLLPLNIPIPIGILLAAVILVYWSLLNLMGYARFQWRTLWGMDIPIFALVLLTAISFYEHPSSFLLFEHVFETESETIGGKEYVLCLFGTIAYITVSLLPLDYKDCSKLAKYRFWLACGCLIIGLAKSVLMPGSSDMEDEMDLADQASGTRFMLLMPLGFFAASYIYAAFPVLQLIRKPFYLVLLFAACGGVILSGWRNRLIELCLRFFVIAAIKKELTLLICLGSFAYGTLLFLSNEQLLDDLPFGVQRSLCAVPGVHVRKDVEKTAKGSSDWRVVMWHWALDPRTGYIKDYVWGDGFSESRADMRRDSIAHMRGTLQRGKQQTFAKRGVWHSGWISSMHRLGIVGLVCIIIIQLSVIFHFYRLCFLLWKVDKQTGLYYVVVVISLIARIPLYHLSAGTPRNIYASMLSYATLKLYYCCTKEHFKPRVQDSFGRYVPLLIQEMNTPVAPARLS